MKQLCSFLCLVLFLFTHSQENVLLKGYVSDAANKQPLSLAAVQVKNTQLGALTEDNGYFELPVPKSNLNDSLRISFVGYLTRTISVAGYQQSDTLYITLETQVATKEEVVVTAMNARGVLLKAIENMKKNLFTDSLIQHGFYRQVHKENGTYVRLLEADISVAFNTKSPYKYSFHETVQTNKMRRSANFETNGDVHGDHLVDLLKENPVSYNKQNLLNPKMIDFLSPKFDSEDEEQYVLKTQYKETSSAKLEQARLWIQKETFAILKIEIEKFPNPYYIKPKYTPDTRWKLVNETDVIQLEKVDGRYVVSSLERTYNHHVHNRQTGQVEFIVEESFGLYFYQYETSGIGEKLGKGNFISTTSLYETLYKYDETFWKNYKPLQSYPLPNQIIQDLGKKNSLDHQFRESGKANLGKE